MRQEFLVSNFSLFIVYLDNFSGGSKAIETIKVLSRIVCDCCTINYAVHTSNCLPKPDRTFRNIRGFKYVDPRLSCSSEALIGWFWFSEVVNCSVGASVWQIMRYVTKWGYTYSRHALKYNIYSCHFSLARSQCCCFLLHMTRPYTHSVSKQRTPHQPFFTGDTERTFH